MKIGEILNKDAILLDQEFENKDEALKTLTKALYEIEGVSDKELFLEDVYKREAQGVTGMGDGVAIPHGKSRATIKPSLAIAILNKEIEWESLDDSGAKLVILLAVPDDNEGALEHLKLLAQISRKLARKSVVDSLFSAKTKDDVINTFLMED